jgi:hypothetical protein
MDAVMVVNAGGGATCSFPYPFSAMFKKIVVKMGGATIQEIDNYGYLAGLMRGQQSSVRVNLIDDDGSSVGATRATNSVTNQTYTFSLDIDLLHRVIPTNYLGNGAGLEVWFYPDILTNFAEWSVGAPISFTLSNMKFYLHEIQGTPEVKAVIDSQIQAGLNISVDAWTTFQMTLTSSTNQQAQLPFKGKCLKAIIGMLTPTADLTSGIVVTPGSRYINDFPYTNIQTFSLKVGSKVYPSQPWDFSTAQSYKILKKITNGVLDKWSHVYQRNGDAFVDQYTPNQNQQTAFIQTADLRLDTTQENLLGNGLDNSIESMPLLWNLTYTGAPGAFTGFFLCQQEGTLTINTSGVRYDA